MSASKTKQALWMVAGYFILIPFCLARAWKPCMSTINPYGREPREIDEWKWAWLNSVYGNYEDSVSGAKALIWNDRGERVPYMPTPEWMSGEPVAAWFWEALRAWLWSAWRNSTNELSR